jgi:eukaryotic-like serine/threonine-protein kinase
MPILLTVVRGPHAGRTFEFTEHDTFLVGRSASAHFSLPADPYFSRHHLLVEVNPPLCRLTDLESHNGTLVNGARVRGPVDLRDGDRIEAGRTVLEVAIRPPGPEQPTLDLPAPPLPAGADPPTLPAPPPADGTLTVLPAVPGYRDLAELGRGAMGVVYRAARAADGAAVAVKTVRPALQASRGVVDRFLREARILQSLSHPRIVRFHEMGEAGGWLYFVMDLVPGTDAARLVRERGPLPVAEAVGLVGQLCDGLGHAHRQGFVHRDVKPANLLLAAASGGGWDLRLADFGLARAYQDSPLSGLTVSGDCGGTPVVMPPEQVTNFRAVGPPADQYAAAATAFFLLAGRYPFAGRPEAVLRQVLAGTPARLDDCRPGLPAGLAAAVHRALAVRPEERFPDVAAFADALRPWAASG